MTAARSTSGMKASGKPERMRLFFWPAEGFRAAAE
jgi:hypothetical protein